MEAIYTPATLAKRWECSEKHVRTLIKAGRLKAFRLGGKLFRIKESDVERFECQSGELPGFEESSLSHMNETESGNGIRSEPMTRVKLTALRLQSTPS